MKKKITAFLLCVILTNLCLAQSTEQKQTVGNAYKIPAAKIEALNEK